MRGEERRQRAMLRILEPGDRVPTEHSLRRVKEVADTALAELSPLFDEMYSGVGRSSIPPERLLKSSLLMALYTVRSERMFCEQLDYNLLFRWFPDLDVAEPSCDHSSFSRNRARPLEHDVAREFFTRVVVQACSLRLLSDEHFTVDGMLVEVLRGGADAEGFGDDAIDDARWQEHRQRPVLKSFGNRGVARLGPRRGQGFADDLAHAFG